MSGAGRPTRSHGGQGVASATSHRWALAGSQARKVAGRRWLSASCVWSGDQKGAGPLDGGTRGREGRWWVEPDAQGPEAKPGGWRVRTARLGGEGRAGRAPWVRGWTRRDSWSGRWEKTAVWLQRAWPEAGGQANLGSPVTRRHVVTWEQGAQGRPGPGLAGWKAGASWGGCSWPRGRRAWCSMLHVAAADTSGADGPRQQVWIWELG